MTEAFEQVQGYAVRPLSWAPTGGIGPGTAHQSTLRAPWNCGGICTDGALLLERMVDGMGDVAPRLNDFDVTEAHAFEPHALLLNQIVRMFCAGVVHAYL